MAGYNIVLNLGGNAVSNSERLATNLAAAAANATTLASALRSVGAAYRSIPNRRFTVPSAPRQSRPYAADGVPSRAGASVCSGGALHAPPVDTHSVMGVWVQPRRLQRPLVIGVAA